MLMEPMPGLTRTFPLVLQQERKFGGQLPQVPQESSNLAAFNDNSTRNNSSSRGVFSNNRGGGRSGKGNSTARFTRFCTKCKKTNHTLDTCFQIYGFPPGYRTDGKNTSTTSKPSVNVVDTISPTTSNTSAQDDIKPQNNFSFSKDQYQALLALLQQSQDQDSSTSINSAHICSLTTPETYLQEDWSS